jgi:septal ring factor EnvC (AmiA/AmiB activator)
MLRDRRAYLRGVQRGLSHRKRELEATRWHLAQMKQSVAELREALRDLRAAVEARQAAEARLSEWHEEREARVLH